MMDPQISLRIILGVSAAGSSIASIEFLTLVHLFRDEGPFSWKVQRLRSPLRRLLDLGGILVAWPGILGILIFRAAAAIACVVFACLGPIPPVVIAAYVLAGILFALRSAELLDGAERMSLVTSAACLLAAIGGTAFAREIAIFFLAAQLSMAYAASGFAKLFQPGWRSGRYLLDSLSTRLFGRAGVYRFLAPRPRLVRSAAGVLFVGEIAGSLAPWLPMDVTAPLLISAALFHLLAAAIMGLNTFFFAFVAVFPAAVFTSRMLYP